MEWFTGKRECTTCGEKFPYKEREQVFELQGIDSETNLDLLRFCSNKCVIINQEAMTLHDQVEHEMKTIGYVSEESKFKMVELSRRIKYG